MGKLFYAKSARGTTPTEGSRMIGTNVLEQTDAYLSLYAAYLGISKSSLVRSIIYQWVADSNIGEDEMIEHLATEAYKELIIRQNNRTDKTKERIYNEFIHEIWDVARRSKRGLYDSQIEKIVEAINGKIEKEKDRSNSAS